MKKLMFGTDLVAEAETFEWVDEQHGWSDGKTIYADTDRQFTVVADAQKVSPVQFKLLFTPMERVAIKAERATDPVIDDFFDVVDDPRLTFVDLGLQSTKDAISYLVRKNMITKDRADEVLSGVLK